MHLERTVCVMSIDVLILDKPFVNVVFEGHPLDHRATHAVAVQVLPVHVMYNNDIISRLSMCL